MSNECIESELYTGKIDAMINALITQFLRIMDHPITAGCYSYDAQKIAWPHKINTGGVEVGMGLQTSSLSTTLNIYMSSPTTDIRVTLYLDSDHTTVSQSTLKIICNRDGLETSGLSDHIELTHVELSDDTIHLMMQLYNACGEAHNKQMENSVIPELETMLQSTRAIELIADTGVEVLKQPILRTDACADRVIAAPEILVTEDNTIPSVKEQFVMSVSALITQADDIDSGRYPVVVTAKRMGVIKIRELLEYIYQVQREVGDFKLSDISADGSGMLRSFEAKQRFEKLLKAGVIYPTGKDDTYRTVESYVVILTYQDYIKGIILRHIKNAGSSTTGELIKHISTFKCKINALFPCRHNTIIDRIPTTYQATLASLVNDKMITRTDSGARSHRPYCLVSSESK